jgi:vacuolar protein sorting-associated protein 35
VEQVEILLSVLAPLAEDQSDGPTANEWEDPEEFVEEQGLMGRVIHLLRSPNPDMQYQILSCARKHLGQGGPKRIGFTLPPIVVSAFQLNSFMTLEKRMKSGRKKWQKYFNFVIPP